MANVFDKNKWVELDLVDHIALKGCISYSGLKHLARSTAHYLARNKQEISPQKRAVMDFGSAVDCALFTPQDFSRLVVTCPTEYLASNGAMSTKKAREWRAAQDDKALILKRSDFDRIEKIVGVLKSKRSVMKLLRRGYAQKSGLFKLPEICGDNVWAKIRPDWISASFGANNLTVVDYKTTEDASFEAFQRLIYNLKYHWQGAMYTLGATAITGVEHKNFAWIVQERKEPYEVAVYQADADMLSLARKEMLPLLQKWGRLQSGQGDWDEGYPDVIQKISLPYWAEKKVEADLERQHQLENGGR